MTKDETALRKLLTKGTYVSLLREMTISVSSRARVLVVCDRRLSDYAFCMIPSTARAPLAKRKRRREAEMDWL